jgi:aminoglycoside phosphotransferase (APT) family kinase protein
MMPTAEGFRRAEKEGQYMMSSYLNINERRESVGFLGVWEEDWRTRAEIASQAERYRTWLRAQGRTRDEAAELAVRFLASHPPAGPHQLTPLGKPTIH